MDAYDASSEGVALLISFVLVFGIAAAIWIVTSLSMRPKDKHSKPVKKVHPKVAKTVEETTPVAYRRGEVPNIRLLLDLPPIPQTPMTTRVLTSLMRGGYATGKFFPLEIDTVDWSRIKSIQDETLIHSIRSFGSKSLKIVRQWISIIESDYPELLEKPSKDVLERTSPTSKPDNLPVDPASLICERPPITIQHKATMLVLTRAGYAHSIMLNKFVVDWYKLQLDRVGENPGVVRGIGKKRSTLIKKWLSTIKADCPSLLLDPGTPLIRCWSQPHSNRGDPYFPDAFCVLPFGHDSTCIFQHKKIIADYDDTVPSHLQRHSNAYRAYYGGENMTYKKIAKIVGRSPEVVRQWIARYKAEVKEDKLREIAEQLGYVSWYAFRNALVNGKIQVTLLESLAQPNDTPEKLASSE